MPLKPMSERIFVAYCYHSDFLKKLPTDDCRYAVVNFEYDQGSDGKRSKIVFVNWFRFYFDFSFWKGPLKLHPPKLKWCTPELKLMFEKPLLVSPSKSKELICLRLPSMKFWANWNLSANNCFCKSRLSRGIKKKKYLGPGYLVYFSLEVSLCTLCLFFHLQFLRDAKIINNLVDIDWLSPCAGFNCGERIWK